MALSWAALAVFAGLVLVVALYGLAVSGHFPAEHRAPRLRDRTGGTVLWGSMALACAAALAAVVLGARALPWTAAVIAGGAALLAAPLVLQRFPDSFVDGRRGLVVLAAAATVLAGLFYGLTR